MERADWKAKGLDSFVSDDGASPQGEADALPPGATAISAHVSGNVWKILVEEGETVISGQAILIIESMKMEMEITAPISGCVTSIRCFQGRMVRAGDIIGVLE
jgi:urea carboxylase